MNAPPNSRRAPWPRAPGPWPLLALTVFVMALPLRGQDRAPPTAPQSGFNPGLVPTGFAISADGRYRLDATYTPGTTDQVVRVTDRETAEVVERVLRGSSNLRGVAVSPDARFALVAHVRPRSHLPATQIVEGWVFTNVVSYLSLEVPNQTPIPLPLDEPARFYATPFGIAIHPDGTTAYVTHAGADVVSVLDLAALEQVARETAGRRSDYARRGENLAFTRRYVLARVPTGANPREIALSPDGREVVVSNHLDGTQTVIDARTFGVLRTDEDSAARPEGQAPAQPAAQRDDPQTALVRRGEVLFNSAQLSFQGQFSCASCHPDGHTDGLNWDLPADGIGNFLNTKSLLGIAGTQPFGWHGTSADFPERFGGTLRHLFQHQPSDQELAAITAYLEQLRWPQNREGEAPAEPERIDADAESAARGRTLFEGRGRCTVCHSGPRFTDRRRHDIGTASAADLDARFDTPSLVAVAHTAPYLHDGRAATLEEIFTTHNSAGLHGAADELTAEEIHDLGAYLRSL